MDSRPLGFFDSGVGGISIWKAVHRLLPHENTLYLADNKNAPYGDKTKEEIIHLSEKNTEFLLEYNAKLIVVACNTASTNAIPHLRQKYRVPFIRIQPALKPAMLQSRAKKVGLLATAGTLESEMLEELKQIIPAKDVEIISRYGKGLVEIVEKGKMNSRESRSLLKKYLEPMKRQGVDKLVLGCTHYPFLQEEMQEILGNQVEIIEPSEAIARQTKRVLEDKNALAPEIYPAKHYFWANQETKILYDILKEYPSARIDLKRF